MKSNIKQKSIRFDLIFSSINTESVLRGKKRIFVQAFLLVYLIPGLFGFTGAAFGQDTSFGEASFLSRVSQGETLKPKTYFQVREAWIRLPAKGRKATAAYISFDNPGEKDTLTGVETEISQKASLHTSVNQDNIVRMRAVPSIRIAKQGSLTMQPGGYHIMLMGLKRPIKIGETIPLILHFKNRGSILFPVKVRTGESDRHKEIQMHQEEPLSHDPSHIHP